MFDVGTLLEGAGPWALALIGLFVFIESGVLFPFLPGDTLLVTGAIVAHRIGLEPWQIFVVAAVCGVAGDQVGYWLGSRFGARLFSPTARILKTAYLDEARLFFDRYGPAALILGRFLPIVRTYVPVAAGATRMPYRRFAVWNVIGAVSWAGSLVLVGTLLGNVPAVVDHTDVLAIVIVLVAVIPMAIDFLRRRRRARRSGD